MMDPELSLTGRLEVRVDHDAAPGDVLPALARLLLDLVDKRRNETLLTDAVGGSTKGTSRQGAANTGAALTTTSL